MMRRGRYLSTRALQLDADTVSSATQIISWLTYLGCFPW